MVLIFAQSSSRSSEEEQLSGSQGGRRGGRGGRKRGRRSSRSSEEEEEDRSLRRRVIAEEPEDEEEGEDLLAGDTMAADYQRIEALDTYEGADLDEREYDALDAETRARAEAEMAARDVTRGLRPEGLGLSEEGEETTFHGRMRRLRRQAGEAEGEEEEGGYAPFDIANYDVPLAEWVATEPVRAEIRRQFEHFLNSYVETEGDEPVYERAVDRMCARNEQSLVVSYLHLSQAVPLLAVWLADMPKDMLFLMNQVAKKLVLERYPDYADIHDEIFVRIRDLPIADSLRELRHIHLNALIKVSGVVTRRTSVFPQLKVARFACGACGSLTEPIVVGADGTASVGACTECQARGPWSLNAEQTVYRNYQKITLQETPGSVPAGRVPRYKEVVLLADLIDAARPGEEVEVTGVYTHSYDAALNTRQGFPVFATLLEANHVQKRHAESMSEQLTEEDLREIETLRRDPRIADRIIKSIAPSIYGHEHVKMAVAMSLFGGCEKNHRRKHRIRGDINVLLLGDPGTAKSQVLKYVEKTAPRAVYTTGKGASAVGLTAAVHRDPLTGEWTLEGGALVLADRGTCLIDEFDKMNDADRTSIHEAMEQQSISISKAGIVTTLQARCGVIAAANPIGGRYDSSKTFADNVQLTDPILQRFDILCVLIDTVDPDRDTALAKHVMGSHIRSHPALTERREQQQQQQQQSSQTSQNSQNSQGPEQSADDAAMLAAAAAAEAAEASGAATREDEDLIPQDLLRKYIIYARAHCRPSLTDINQDKIASLYADLRRESETSDGVPIAVRHIESMMRMSEAHARMHMRAAVTDADLDVSVRVMLESFIQAQKRAVIPALRRHFARYLAAGRDVHQLLEHLLRRLYTVSLRAHASVRARALVGRDAAAPQAASDGDAGVVDEAAGEVVIAAQRLEREASAYGVDPRAVRNFLTSDNFSKTGFTTRTQGRVLQITRDLHAE